MKSTLCCDMIILFKIMLGITICNVKNAFVLSLMNLTCKNSYKLVTELC